MTLGRRPRLYYRASDVKKPARKKLRVGRLVLYFCATCVLLVGLVWYAVHHFDWAGPLVANSLRAVVGDDTVAKLEDFVYGAEDHVNRLLKKNEPPRRIGAFRMRVWRARHRARPTAAPHRPWLCPTRPRK